MKIMPLPPFFARRGQRICYLEGHTERKNSKMIVWLCEKCQVWGKNLLASPCTILDTTRPWDLSLKGRINFNIILPLKFSACFSKCNVQVKPKSARWRCPVWLNTPELNNDLLQTWGLREAWGRLELRNELVVCSSPHGCVTQDVLKISWFPILEVDRNNSLSTSSLTGTWNYLIIGTAFISHMNISEVIQGTSDKAVKPVPDISDIYPVQR